MKKLRISLLFLSAAIGLNGWEESRHKEVLSNLVLTYGIGPELAQIANGMEKLGWKVPMIGSWMEAMRASFATLPTGG